MPYSNSGPPTAFSEFDQASVNHAQATLETQATQVVSPDLQPAEKPSLAWASWPLALFYLAAEAVIWAVVWGFFQLLPYRLSSELTALLNVFTSSGALTVAGLIIAAVLMLLEQSAQLRIKQLQARWIDGLDSENDCYDLRSIRLRLKQLSRFRSSSLLALTAYIFVRGL